MAQYKVARNKYGYQKAFAISSDNLLHLQDVLKVGATALSTHSFEPSCHMVLHVHFPAVTHI
jgi:hypothetical protein